MRALVSLRRGSTIISAWSMALAMVPAAAWRPPCGRKSSTGGRCARAVDQCADHLQVFGDFFMAATREQGRSVVGKGLQRGQGLVQLVADAGRHLTQRGELAGLDRGIARFAQDGLGVFEGGDLFGEVGRAFGDAGFQLGIDAAQFLTAPGAVAERRPGRS